MSYHVDRKTIAADWPLFVVLVADLIFGFWALGRMPARVPIHWGVGGPNGWGPGWMGAIFLPLLNIAAYWYNLYAPGFSAKAQRYASNPVFYRVLRSLALLVLAFLHVALVIVTLKYYA